MAYIGNKDFRYKVGQGEISDASTVNKFAFNPDVDAASEEVIANFGGTFSIMTSADTLDVVSTSAQDGVAGTGALTILITGIDAAYLTQTETVTMNGVTPVTTSNSWLGINRVVVLTSGTNDGNVGTITIDDTAGTVGTQAQLSPDESVTQQLIYHTQIGFTLLLDWLWLHVTKLSGGSAPKVTIRGLSYSRVTDTMYEIFRTTLDSNVENTEQFTPSQPFVLGGREVVYFVADTDTNNTEVVGRFSGIEIINS
jgi:hypothetical protein